MDVVEYQQKSTRQMHDDDQLYYSFGRMTTNSIDTLFGGTGQPSKPCGLSRSPFRPSDDSHVLPFLIPANAMASTVLEATARMFSTPLCSVGPKSAEIASRASALSSTIRGAILSTGIISVPGFVAFGEVSVSPSLISLRLSQGWQRLSLRGRWIWWTVSNG